MEQWSWSDESFCERVAERCKKLGKSQRSVLREAQCAHDYLQTNPTHGRRIDRIWRIAEVLDMPVGNLLGLPVNGQIDTEMLLLAYRAAREAIELVQQPTDQIFVETMATLYTVLLARQAAGHDPRDPEYLKLTVDILRARAASALRS